MGPRMTPRPLHTLTGTRWACFEPTLPGMKATQSDNGGTEALGGLGACQRACWWKGWVRERGGASQPSPMAGPLVSPPHPPLLLTFWQAAIPYNVTLGGEPWTRNTSIFNK